ncbi:MAG: recombinase family protein [Anaerorhabdus sp.]
MTDARVRVYKPISKTENKKLKIRVAAYCRVSTDMESQETSIESQKRYYEQLIQNRPEWELVGIYSDEGKSGTNLIYRDEFNRMVKDSEKGLIDLIITKSVSRFARNTVDSISTIRKLKSYNVGVFFETENTNTLDPSWELMITMMSAFAQEESRAKSNAVKWGYARKFENGESVLSTLYGYRSTGKKGYKIEESEAQVVKRIFREFLEGSSLNEIALRLNGDCIPTRLKKKWNKCVIDAMLKNIKYTGDAIQGLTYSPDYTSKKRIKNEGEVNQYFIEDAHPAIITKEIYSLVQREIERRKMIGLNKADFEKDFKQSHGYSFKYPIGNVLECAYCGAKYRRQIWTSRGNRRVVWRCTNRLVKGVKACPDSVTIHDEWIKEKIVEAINKMFKNKEEITNSLKLKINSMSKIDIEEEKIKLIESIQVYENHYKQLLNDNIGKSKYNAKKLSGELEEIASSISEKEKNLSRLLDNKAILYGDIIYYNFINKELSLREIEYKTYENLLIYKYFESIIVYKNDIIFKFNNSHIYNLGL